MTITMYGSRSAGSTRVSLKRLDVAGRGAREPPVAVLHLVHGPLERRLRALGLGDHRHQQVRQAVVARELDALEVHQDHPDVVRRGVAQQARDQRVDHHALARAGGARDQQVRHLGEVHGLRPGRRRPGRGRTSACDPDAAKSTSSRIRRSATTLNSALGISMPDGALARDRRLDPDAARRERHRQVVRERLDPAELDVRRRLDLVLGDDRARRCGRRCAPRCRSSPASAMIALVARVDRLPARRRRRRAGRGPSRAGRCGGSTPRRASRVGRRVAGAR